MFKFPRSSCALDDQGLLDLELHPNFEPSTRPYNTTHLHTNNQHLKTLDRIFLHHTSNFRKSIKDQPLQKNKRETLRATPATQQKTSTFKDTLKTPFTNKMSSAPLSDKDVNTSMSVNDKTHEVEKPGVKSMEYHRQVLASKMEEEK